MLGDAQRLRIVHINLELDEDALDLLYEQGINGMWIVEPLEVTEPGSRAASSPRRARLNRRVCRASQTTPWLLTEKATTRS